MFFNSESNSSIIKKDESCNILSTLSLIKSVSKVNLEAVCI